MIDLITTFNNKLFNEYSKNLLDTFIEKSDDSLRLNIFYEGDFGEIKNNYISYDDKIRFYEFKSKDWNVFYNKFGHLAEANGYNVRYDKFKNSLIADGPSYKWQAVKFSYKIFSIYLASKLEKISNKIVWIDADTICISDLNESDLIQFLPKEDELMSYLGRDSFPPEHPHSETGFLGFNLLHERFEAFIKTAISFYTTGELFALKLYHDCIIYDTTRTIFEMSGTKFKNLSGKFISESHPFVKCALGNYFDHLKGNRKQLGYSPEHQKHNQGSNEKNNEIELNFV